MEEDYNPDLAIPRLWQNDIDLYELDFGDRAVHKGLLLLADELRDIAAALKKNTRLKKLSLQHHNLRYLDNTSLPTDYDERSHSFGELLDSLKQNHGLTELDLRNNPALLCDRFLERLLFVLQHENHTITKVYLLGEKEKEDDIVPPVIPGLIDLIHYIAELNKYPVQLKVMAYRAKINDSSLFEFELYHDPLDIKVYNEGSTKEVVGAMARNDTVRTLRMDRCCPGVHCIEVLKETLANNPYLTRVTLANNLLTPYSGVLIANALKANPHTRLESLDLRDNLLDDESADALTDLLSTNETLRTVFMEGNLKLTQDAATRLRNAAAFNGEPPGLKRIFPRLKRNDPTLTVVDLQGSASSEHGPGRGYYTNLGAQVLADVLRANNAVHTINLSHNHIGPDGARALAGHLRNNPYVTRLDMSQNPLGDEGAKHFTLALQYNDELSECTVAGCEASERLVKDIQALTRMNAQPLPVKALLLGKESTVPEGESTVLDLAKREEQPLGKWPALRPSSSPYVVTILRERPRYTELTLKGNRAFGDVGVEQLSQFLAEGARCNLTKINLVDTGITDNAIHSILTALKSNYKLKIILTQGNPDLTVRPVQALDDALLLNNHAPPVKDVVPLLQQNVPGIKALHFSHRRELAQHPQIGDDSARILSSALRVNKHVTVVDLSGQDISNRGAGYLVEILSESPEGSNATITSLDLSHNTIGPDGALSLAQMLEKNTTLKTLKLHNNRLQDVGVQHLLQALKLTNRNLTSLTLQETESSRVVREQVQALVSSNGQQAEFRLEVLERLGVLQHVKHIGSTESGTLDASSIAALEHCIAIHPIHNIHTIELRNNSLSMEALRTLARVVTENEKFKSLLLSDNSPEPSTNNEVSTDVLALSRDTLNSRSPLSQSVNSTGPGRAWNHATVNQLFYELSESCPWLTTLECTEGGSSILNHAATTSVLLNREHINFRTFYRRLRDVRDKLDYILVPQAIELAGQNLTTASLRLLFDGLLMHTDYTPDGNGVEKLRMLNFCENDFTDESIEYLSSCLIGRAKLLQSLYLNGNAGVGAKAVAALREFVWTSDSICFLSVESTPAQKLSEAFMALNKAGDLVGEEVALAGSSLASIETKLQANREHMGTEKAAVMTLVQRRVKPSVGSPFKEADTSGVDVERLLNEEAFAAMPHRQKYVRGQYTRGREAQ